MPSTTFAVHVGEPEIAAGVAIRQTLVVQAEQVQDRRVQVVEVDLVLDRVVAVVVGRAVRRPGFTPPPASHMVNASRIVVAAVGALRSRRAAELAAPDDERVLQQAARLQIVQAAPAIGLSTSRGVLLRGRACSSACWSHL